MPNDAEGPIAKHAYETLAEAYAAAVDTKPHNACYERPATLSLLPDVRGLRVLDAGCGPGVYAECLVERGARVFGIDVSENMVRLARERLGDRAEFRVADLGKPLDFSGAESFDLVLSPLVLDYLEDLRAVFREFHRVLRKGGWLVFSAEHPNSRWRMVQARNYFLVERTEMEWRGFRRKVMMPSFRRPMQEFINPMLDAGFHLDRILEPVPTERFREAAPEDYAELSRAPGFICFRARKELGSVDAVG